MLDLNDIAMFVQVARSGSFADAASRIGMPPNTLSRRVQQLESRLGTRLLQRTTRKLTLTAAGQAFHDRCAASVDGLLAAGQALMAGGDEPAGQLRVAAPADLFDFIPMEWIASFLAKHPLVRLDFLLSDSTMDLIDGQIDVALRGGALRDSGYVGRGLLKARSDTLVASPAYLAARGMPATLRDLATHECIVPGRPGGRANWRLAHRDGRVEDVSVSGRFSGNTAQALRKAAIAGLGIALLPASVTKAYILAHALVPVLEHYRRTGQGLSAIYPSRHQLPPAVSAFIAFLVEKLSVPEALPEALRE